MPTNSICQVNIMLVLHLSPFDTGDDLRTNPSKEGGGNDEDIKDQVSSPLPVGPVTRARAKRFKEELNSLVHKVLNQEETVVNMEGEQRLVILIKVD